MDENSSGKRFLSKLTWFFIFLNKNFHPSGREFPISYHCAIIPLLGEFPTRMKTNKQSLFIFGNNCYFYKGLRAFDQKGGQLCKNKSVR
ncbi:hypothetical protein HR11_05110 [Porphyromonas macacae]|uniref:hypothetical protein n=1 Tax=Porphyromonas macacae TaxID=28115 RepID=UPI00037927DB|nr:hypothetical protein [Porphyromonas macacae]KGN99616.1 hypothetical protein HR11_05110 [Porphyromonas macacae]